MKSLHCSGTYCIWSSSVNPQLSFAIYQIAFHQKSTLQFSTAPFLQNDTFTPFSKKVTLSKPWTKWFWEGPSPELGRSTHPEWPSVAVWYSTIKTFVFVPASGKASFNSGSESRVHTTDGSGTGRYIFYYKCRLLV
jgi:hypothetical protein